MRDRTIYIVVTRTNTFHPEPFGFIPAAPTIMFPYPSTAGWRIWSVSARLYPSMPMPGGFVHEGKNKGFFRHFRDTHCRVYSKTIGEWEYQKFLHLLHKIENRSCKFNHLGLLTLIAGIPLERKNAYFCSQFCGKMLNESGIHHFHKPFGLLRPADFCDLNGFTLLYEGPLHAFENQKAAVPA